jgi:hypothetical protein
MPDRIKISKEQASFGGEPYRDEKVRLSWEQSARIEVYSRRELEEKIKHLEDASLPVLPEYREALTWFTGAPPTHS